MLIVFTSGYFDRIDRYHVDFLEMARALGDRLVVGLNSDQSLRAIKGGSVALVPQEDRSRVLQGLRAVDEVVIFDEPTPTALVDALAPDILVVADDDTWENALATEIVVRRGGRVVMLRAGSELLTRPSSTASRDVLMYSLFQHIETIDFLGRACREQIEKAAALILKALVAGHRLYLCGNGGSAADAQHIAAEFAGRFEYERRPYPALALTANSSIITAIANDYGFEYVFARQVEAYARRDDVFIGISTSGNSANVLEAVIAARKQGCYTIGLTGKSGARLASLCDVAVMVPATRTSRIQEAHIVIGHSWCEIVDDMLQRQGSE